MLPVSPYHEYEPGPKLVCIDSGARSDSLSRSTGLELVLCRYIKFVQDIFLVSLGILGYEG